MCGRVDGETPIRGVILDLDGTIYRQGPVRRAMARRLAWHLAAHPRAGLRTLRFIRAYREAQEELRASGGDRCASEQIDVACRKTGEGAHWGAALVRQWMEIDPLPMVARHMRPDLVAFLDAADRQRVPVAVFSDYPADAKLKAMGIRERLKSVRCAQDDEIAVFKPHPRGLLVTADALGVEPRFMLHVGDRPHVDATAARAAGMQSAIIESRPGDANDTGITVASFSELISRLGW